MILPDPSLSINLVSPLLHSFLGIESNDEILDARIAFPEDLASVRTWFRKGYRFCDILHKDTAFELKLRFSLAIHKRFVHHSILLLVWINFLAAKEDHLEEVDFVLSLFILCAYAFALEYSERAVK
jgi:hypothetical protein